VLFKPYAFGKGKQERLAPMTGKDIVKKCGASPLVAQVL